MNRIARSFKYRVLDRDYVVYLARRSMQARANKLLNLSLRLLGFNNYGPVDKSGERYFLECFASTNPVFCVDVGANVGRYSEFLLSNTSSDVFAFEPLPGAFERLKILKEKFEDRFVIVNKGCAEKSDALELCFGSDSSELASFSSEVKGIDYVGNTNVNSIFVETTSLDDFFDSSQTSVPERCDLIKIDTEGFEYEVLRGAIKFIEKYKPRMIQIEFNLNHLFRGHSLKFLTKNIDGYIFFRILPNRHGMVQCNVDEFSSNVFQYSNYLLVEVGAWSDSDFRAKFKA